MAFGPGKYDDLCTYVRQKAGIDDESGGGVLLIVVGGNKGPGFSCQADLGTMLQLPDLLELTAKQMRADTLKATQ